MDSDGDIVVGETHGENRGKRKKPKNITKREQSKKVRYSCHYPSFEEFEMPCKHKENSTYSCGKISIADIVAAHQQFFANPNKIKQDEKIAHMMTLRSPQRRRPLRRLLDHQHRKGPHKFEVKYNIWCKGRQRRVCKKFFMAVFPVKNKRLWTIAKQITAGTGIKENRGGDRKSKKNEEKRTEVEKFINSLKATESHYDRKKSKRLYLPSHLNIAKLCKIYNQNADQNKKVNYGFFSKVFNNSFNIGFGTPATDVCGLCCRLKNAVKAAQTQVEKQRNITELRVHKLRAKQFNMMMKEKPEGSFSVCFDMQQVQPLPKLPIQDAFYSHQISYYNICFVDLQNNKPHFYSWTENQAKRGASEISSALLHYLRNVNYPDGCNIIRLFSDGCGGQNKNCHVIHTLSYWLYYDAPAGIDTILFIFPVRGHSYLPADRVFGRVEKNLRKRSTILHKADYVKLYEVHGSVRKLGEDYKLYNIRSLLENMKKTEGIAGMKRIFIKRSIDKKTNEKTVRFKMEPCYRNDDLSKPYLPILKKGKKMNSCKLSEIKPYQKILPKKIKTLVPLLNAYNANWTELEEYSWYQEILCDTEENGEELGEESDQVVSDCECLSEEEAMLV